MSVVRILVKILLLVLAVLMAWLSSYAFGTGDPAAGVASAVAAILSFGAAIAA